MEFRHVVPLGSRCRTTHNLRLHFGVTDGDPFDWYILPLAGLVTMLEEGLDSARVYEPAQLVSTRDAEGRLHSVRNRRLGILHHHDFPRGEGDVLLPGWEEHVEKAAQRFTYLSGRLRTHAAEGEVLFVRERHKADDPAQLLRLKALLAALCPSFTLLAVNYAEGTVPEGVEAIQVAEEEGRGWRGDPEAWGAALGGTGHGVRR